MAPQKTTLTRKGQITIPVDIRRQLGIAEGDQLDVERDEDTVIVRRATSVTALTAGILAKYRKPEPLTAEEEREAFAQAVADDVSKSEDS